MSAQNSSLTATTLDVSGNLTVSANSSINIPSMSFGTTASFENSAEITSSAPMVINLGLSSSFRNLTTGKLNSNCSVNMNSNCTFINNGQILGKVSALAITPLTNSGTISALEISANGYATVNNTNGTIATVSGISDGARVQFTSVGTVTNFMGTTPVQNKMHTWASGAWSAPTEPDSDDYTIDSQQEFTDKFANGIWTIASGESYNVSSNVSLTMQVGQTLNIYGALTFGTGSTLSSSGNISLYNSLVFPAQNSFISGVISLYTSKTINETATLVLGEAQGDILKMPTTLRTNGVDDKYLAATITAVSAGAYRLDYMESSPVSTGVISVIPRAVNSLVLADGATLYLTNVNSPNVSITFADNLTKNTTIITDGSNNLKSITATSNFATANSNRIIIQNRSAISIFDKVEIGAFATLNNIYAASTINSTNGYAISSTALSTPIINNIGTLTGVISGVTDAKLNFTAFGTVTNKSSSFANPNTNEIGIYTWSADKWQSPVSDTIINDDTEFDNKFVNGVWTIASGETFTIAAGTTVTLNAGNSLIVEGTLSLTRSSSNVQMATLVAEDTSTITVGSGGKLTVNTYSLLDIKNASTVTDGSKIELTHNSYVKINNEELFSNSSNSSAPNSTLEKLTDASTDYYKLWVVLPSTPNYCPTAITEVVMQTSSVDFNDTVNDKLSVTQDISIDQVDLDILGSVLSKFKSISLHGNSSLETTTDVEIGSLYMPEGSTLIIDNRSDVTANIVVSQTTQSALDTFAVNNDISTSQLKGTITSTTDGTRLIFTGVIPLLTELTTKFYTRESTVDSKTEINPVVNQIYLWSTALNGWQVEPEDLLINSLEEFNAKFINNVWTISSGSHFEIDGSNSLSYAIANSHKIVIDGGGSLSLNSGATLTSVNYGITVNTGGVFTLRDGSFLNSGNTYYDSVIANGDATSGGKVVIENMASISEKAKIILETNTTLETGKDAAKETLVVPKNTFEIAITRTAAGVSTMTVNDSSTTTIKSTFTNIPSVFSEFILENSNNINLVVFNGVQNPNLNVKFQRTTYTSTNTIEFEGNNTVKSIGDFSDTNDKNANFLIVNNGSLVAESINLSERGSLTNGTSANQSAQITANITVNTVGFESPSIAMIENHGTINGSLSASSENVSLRFVNVGIFSPSITMEAFPTVYEWKSGAWAKRASDNSINSQEEFVSKFNPTTKEFIIDSAFTIDVLANGTVTIPTDHSMKIVAGGSLSVQVGTLDISGSALAEVQGGGSITVGNGATLRLYTANLDKGVMISGDGSKVEFLDGAVLSSSSSDVLVSDLGELKLGSARFINTNSEIFIASGGKVSVSDETITSNLPLANIRDFRLTPIRTDNPSGGYSYDTFKLTYKYNIGTISGNFPSFVGILDLPDTGEQVEIANVNNPNMHIDSDVAITFTGTNVIKSMEIENGNFFNKGNLTVGELIVNRDADSFTNSNTGIINGKIIAGSTAGTFEMNFFNNGTINAKIEGNATNTSSTVATFTGSGTFADLSTFNNLAVVKNITYTWDRTNSQWIKGDSVVDDNTDKIITSQNEFDSMFNGGAQWTIYNNYEIACNLTIPSGKTVSGVDNMLTVKSGYTLTIESGAMLSAHTRLEYGSFLVSSGGPMDFLGASKRLELGNNVAFTYGSSTYFSPNRVGSSTTFVTFRNYQDSIRMENGAGEYTFGDQDVPPFVAVFVVGSGTTLDNINRPDMSVEASYSFSVKGNTTVKNIDSSNSSSRIISLDNGAVLTSSITFDTLARNFTISGGKFVGLIGLENETTTLTTIYIHFTNTDTAAVQLKGITDSGGTVQNNTTYNWNPTTDVWVAQTTRMAPTPIVPTPATSTASTVLPITPSVASSTASAPLQNSITNTKVQFSSRLFQQLNQLSHFDLFKREDDLV